MQQNRSVFAPFSSDKQVYIDYHPRDGQLGSLWCKGGFEVKRGKFQQALKDGTFLSRIKGRYDTELAVGNLANLPAPAVRN